MSASYRYRCDTAPALRGARWSHGTSTDEASARAQLEAARKAGLLGRLTRLQAVPGSPIEVDLEVDQLEEDGSIGTSSWRGAR